MLSVYHFTVYHNARDHGEPVSVAAHDEMRARLLALSTVRTRHSFPTSVTLFAELNSVGKVAACDF